MIGLFIGLVLVDGDEDEDLRIERRVVVSYIVEMSRA